MSRTVRLYQWASEKASSRGASLWLALLFSLELVLIIPLDAVMMFFCLQKRRNIFLYIMIATLASTISGIAGYLVGHLLWDLVGGWVVPNLISTASFARMSGHIELFENWAVFTGALLPFPLKALSLASGVFHLHLASFVSCLVTARLLRFSFIGLLMAFWGDRAKQMLDRHFKSVLLFLGAKIAAAALFFWILAR